MKDGFGERPGAHLYARIRQDSLEGYAQPATHHAPSMIPQRASTIERPVSEAVAGVSERVAADRSIPETLARQEARISKLEAQVEQERERLREPAHEVYENLTYRLGELHKDLRGPLWRGKEIDIAPYCVKATRTMLRITERDDENEHTITYRHSPLKATRLTTATRAIAVKDGLRELYTMMLTSMAALGSTMGFCGAQIINTVTNQSLNSVGVWAITLGGGVATTAIAAYKAGYQEKVPSQPNVDIEQELKKRPEEAMRLMEKAENTLEAVLHTINTTVSVRTEEDIYRTQHTLQQSRINELERQQQYIQETPLRQDRTRAYPK